MRDDLEIDPPVPAPLPYRYSVREAIPWIGRAIYDTGGQPQYSGGDITDRPSVSVLAGGAHTFYAEERVIHDPGRGTAVDVTDRPSPTIVAGPNDAAEGGGPRNHSKVVHRTHGQHKSQGDVTDRPAPTVVARPASFSVEPETDISKQAIGREYDKLNPGQQSDKYFSLVRADADEPCPTITAAGGQNSGIACVVHPSEKRKFTILEVKRLCSFPDDCDLKGSFAQQWERLGNSVPPLMMFAVAKEIRDRVLLPARAAAKTAARGRGSPGRSTTGSPPKDGGKSPPRLNLVKREQSQDDPDDHRLVEGDRQSDDERRAGGE